MLGGLDSERRRDGNLRKPESTMDILGTVPSFLAVSLSRRVSLSATVFFLLHSRTLDTSHRSAQRYAIVHTDDCAERHPDEPDRTLQRSATSSLLHSEEVSDHIGLMG